MQQDQPGPTQPLDPSLLVLLLAQRGIFTPLSISVINQMCSGMSFRPKPHCALSKAGEMEGTVKHSLSCRVSRRDAPTPARESAGQKQPWHTQACWKTSSGGLWNHWINPKLFSKESISCSCCTQLLPQPHSLAGSLGWLCAALMSWTHSTRPYKVMGLKSHSPSASSASMGRPRLLPSLSRRDRGAVLVSELSPLEQLPHCQPMALAPTLQPRGSHLPFCSCPCPSKSLT